MRAEPSKSDAGTRWEWAIVAGVLVMAGALWLPWHTSGGGVRSAFELSTTASRLDLGPTPLVTVLRWLVAAVPALAAVVWITWLLQARTAFLIAGAVVGVVVAAAGIVVIVASDAVRIGPILGLVGSVAVAIALMGWWLTHRSVGGETEQFTSGDGS